MLSQKLEELRNITQPSKDIDIVNEAKGYIINKYENSKINKFTFYDTDNSKSNRKLNRSSAFYKDFRNYFLEAPKLSRFEKEVLKTSKSATTPLYKMYKETNLDTSR